MDSLIHLLNNWGLVSRPYPRLNSLKTIPFVAAHNHFAHVWQYLPQDTNKKKEKGVYLSVPSSPDSGECGLLSSVEARSGPNRCSLIVSLITFWTILQY